MWQKKVKDKKIWFEYRFEKTIVLYQGTKFFNPLDEIKSKRKAGLKQIHSSLINEVSFVEEPVGDGIYTDMKNIMIYLKTADCLPICFFDSEKKIIGLVHTGWKGTYLKIVKNFVRKLKFERNVKPESWDVVMGHCIKWEDYRVGYEIKEFFDNARIGGIILDKGEIFLDLFQANVKILEEIGIKRIHKFPDEDSFLFYSQRRGEVGRNIFAGIII